jgi:hypothetical protein
VRQPALGGASSELCPGGHSAGMRAGFTNQPMGAQMQNIPADILQKLCELREIPPGKYFVVYLIAIFVATLLDQRFLSDYWRAQFNPFSVKKYGVVATVNILFVLIFVFQFFLEPICK